MTACRTCGEKLLLDIIGRDQCGKCNPTALIPDWDRVKFPPMVMLPPRVEPPPDADRKHPAPHGWWHSVRKPLHPKCLGCYDLQPTLEAAPDRPTHGGGQP